MMLYLLTNNAVIPALRLLPQEMQSLDAVRMLLAIALQESNAEARRQNGNGPAKGYWQFERGGVLGILKHKATDYHANVLCSALDYRLTRYTQVDAARVVHDAIEHNDILAAGFARLNLWWLPQALATTREEGWEQYLEAWRPGKPHPDRWALSWDLAARYVETFDAFPDATGS